MKKNILGFIIIVLLLIVAPSVAGNIETHYTKEAVVINIKNNDEVVVMDEQNEIWSFYGKSYLIGEKVKLVMFNNYTENNIYDDEIVNVKIIKK